MLNIYNHITTQIRNETQHFNLCWRDPLKSNINRDPDLSVTKMRRKIERQGQHCISASNVLQLLATLEKYKTLLNIRPACFVDFKSNNETLKIKLMKKCLDQYPIESKDV